MKYHHKWLSKWCSKHCYPSEDGLWWKAVSFASIYCTSRLSVNRIFCIRQEVHNMSAWVFIRNQEEEDKMLIEMICNSHAFMEKHLSYCIFDVFSQPEPRPSESLPAYFPLLDQAKLIYTWGEETVKRVQMLQRNKLKKRQTLSYILSSWTTETRILFLTSQIKNF